MQAHKCIKSERLEARCSPEQKKLFTYAAELSGCKLTEFATQAMQDAALRIIQEHRVIKLTLRDQQKLLNALEASPKPNKKLVSALKHYKKYFKD